MSEGKITGFPVEPTKGGFFDISVAQLDSLSGDVRLIDVREVAEFSGELGHLKGAELVPLASLPQVAEQWSRNVPLLMICRSGNRSGMAARTLVEKGFEHVANLVGGMIAVSRQEGRD